MGTEAEIEAETEGVTVGECIFPRFPRTVLIFLSSKLLLLIPALTLTLSLVNVQFKLLIGVVLLSPLGFEHIHNGHIQVDLYSSSLL